MSLTDSKVEVAGEVEMQARSPDEKDMKMLSASQINFKRRTSSPEEDFALMCIFRSPSIETDDLYNSNVFVARRSFSGASQQPLGEQRTPSMGSGSGFLRRKCSSGFVIRDSPGCISPHHKGGTIPRSPQRDTSERVEPEALFDDLTPGVGNRSSARFSWSPEKEAAEHAFAARSATAENLLAAAISRTDSSTDISTRKAASLAQWTAAITRADSGSSSTPKAVSLLQRRGISARRLMLVVPTQTFSPMEMHVITDSGSCMASPVPSEKKTDRLDRRNPYANNRGNSFVPHQGGLDTFNRSSLQMSTMSEYRRAMMVRKSRNPAPKQKPELTRRPRAAAASQEKRPRPMKWPSQQLQLAQTQPAFAMRVLVAILICCKNLLMLPVWVVLALFSSTPPWCSPSPTAAQQRRTRGKEIRPSPSSCLDIALDALCESFTP